MTTQPEPPATPPGWVPCQCNPGCAWLYPSDEAMHADEGGAHRDDHDALAAAVRVVAGTDPETPT